MDIPVNLYVEGDRGHDYEMPDPATVRLRCLGRWYCDLPFLVEMKLREGDMGSIIELISENELREDFADQVSSDVRGRFLEILSKNHADARCNEDKGRFREE